MPPVHYVATAPGKLVLLGEYVVLEGAPALVAAMERRAEAHFVSHEAPTWQIDAVNLGVYGQLHGNLRDATQPEGTLPEALGFVAAILRHVLATAGARLPFGTLTLHTDAFYFNRSKLGLGSSAAISCACWHVLRAAAGLEAIDGPTPHFGGRHTGALQALQALHCTVQGGVGSGVDIAASLWGGVIRFQRQVPVLVPQVAALPALQQMVIVPVWSGTSAATAPLLQAFRQLKVRQPRLFWQSCERLAVLAHAGVEFWTLGHVAALLTIVDQVHDALAELGERMGSPIVTPHHQKIALRVRRAGGAYKPSGAGGGDLGIAVCPTPQVASRVQTCLKAAGIAPIPMPLATQGVTVQRREGGSTNPLRLAN